MDQGGDRSELTHCALGLRAPGPCHRRYSKPLDPLAQPAGLGGGQGATFGTVGEDEQLLDGRRDGWHVSAPSGYWSIGMATL